MNDFTPSPGQAEALSAIAAWYKDPWAPQVFRMFGPAGTGKTTIARLVPPMLGLSSWNYAAFSGKAAQVLRSKGCTPANTLHSLVYGAPINLQQIEKRLVAEHDDLHAALIHDESSSSALSPGATRLLGSLSGPEMQERLTDVVSELDSVRRRIWLNGALEWPSRLDGPLQTTGLLLADEVSMVNEKMASDILDNGCRVLVLGDPEQLPPVGGEGYFTKTSPDVMLSEVHRQALESPVLALATRIRQGGRATAEEYTSGRAVDYTEFDQILCWRRATRWGAISYLRNLLGRPVGEPVPGDRVMNLANNKDLGVFNGQTFVVDLVEPGRDEGERLFTLHEESEPDVQITMYGFVYGFTQEGERQAEKQRLGWRGSTALLTFSQALTVHKAQGSEWPNVCVIDETRSLWSMEAARYGSQTADAIARRWLYTAVTRASEAVTLIAK